MKIAAPLSKETLFPLGLTAAEAAAAAENTEI